MLNTQLLIDEFLLAAVVDLIKSIIAKKTLLNQKYSQSKPMKNRKMYAGEGIVTRAQNTHQAGVMISTAKEIDHQVLAVKDSLAEHCIYGYTLLLVG